MKAKAATLAVRTGGVLSVCTPLTNTEFAYRTYDAIRNRITNICCEFEDISTELCIGIHHQSDSFDDDADDETDE